MSRPNLARTLLSQLAVQGIDMGDSMLAATGTRVRTSGEDQPVVTLVLEGVVARLGATDTVSLGLAGPGDLLNLDAALHAGPTENGLWLTRGRQVTLPAARLIEKIDRTTLIETALADLRRRTETVEIEVVRHARGRVTERLAALLHDIHALSGETEIGLRQSDIADLLAVRRAGISTACGELQAVGAVRVARAAILLRDIGALSAAAGSTLTRP